MPRVICVGVADRSSLRAGHVSYVFVIPELVGHCEYFAKGHKL